MARRRTPPIERVLRRCAEDANGCWVFSGALSEGYGKVGLGGREDGLDFCHRITYQHFIGPIPEGLELDHLCRNRACCNPWHVEPVTRWVNTARGMRWRLPRCKNGHDYTVENTRHLSDGTRRCITCHLKNSRASAAAYRARKAAA